MKEGIRVTKSLKVVLCGSLKFLDEMEKLAKKLEGLGFECFLPRFFLGNFYSRRI